MTLRVCANLKWTFTEVDFQERFAAAARAGFSAVEYASPYGHAPRVLREHLSDNGLAQVLINVPTGPPGTPGAAGVGCWPGAQAHFRQGLQRGLVYATELQSPFLHVLAGCPPAGVSRALARSTFLDNLGWAAEHAAGSGVRLLLEAMNATDRPGYLLQTQEETAALVKAVDPSALGVLFDVYHCARGQGDVLARVAALRPWIAHVQVAEPPHRAEPGSGELDWDSIFGQLDTWYTGWIGGEYRPATTTEAGLGWIPRFRLGY